jgi:hypothetical protein
MSQSTPSSPVARGVDSQQGHRPNPVKGRRDVCPSVGKAPSRLGAPSGDPICAGRKDRSQATKGEVGIAASGSVWACLNAGAVGRVSLM